MSQLSNTEKFKSQIDSNSTHPSILVRCRALLWFSMSETFKNGEQNYQSNEVAKLNKKIKSDIDKFVDSVAREKIRILKKDVSDGISPILDRRSLRRRVVEINKR